MEKDVIATINAELQDRYDELKAVVDKIRERRKAGGEDSEYSNMNYMVGKLAGINIALTIITRSKGGELDDND